MLDGFVARTVDAGGGNIFCRLGGTGPPVLLLHGFPETHLMWRDVAPLLARHFTVVAADLPGYGASECPQPAADHSPSSKRAMAETLTGMMSQLGFSRFAIIGHDRGGRVAYRLALDRPDCVRAIAVLDIIPIADAWALADARLTLSFWPWSLLAQPAPLPERLIAACPEAVIADADQWGSSGAAFPEDVRAAYARQLGDPDRLHAICEEFRAAATIDREHDEADQRERRRLACPVLVLWDRAGAIGRWYEERGGPLAIWRRWAGQVSGEGVAGGHFFPEEFPQATAERLGAFLLETMAKELSHAH
jgi:haloacetate dehalogenase